MQRNGHTFRVHCHIVNENVTPLLSLKSSQQLGLIKIVDSHTVIIVTGQTSSSNVLNDPVLRQCKDVFQGLGCLEGEYTIKLKPDAKPVVQPPRKAPVALREAVKEELARLITEGVIAPVTEPTAWVSAMVAVKKKNGKVRICIDPRDLIESIMREHYPLPTFEELATRLPKARVFSVFDAKPGFWQVKLGEASSYVTTFNSPHGRYRWNRMPFGITSATEVWQRKMNEIIESLPGVEVIADDFLVIGFGDTDEAAIQNHDQNMNGFLERARERNLKLAPEKSRLRLKEVSFIGHEVTSEGIVADPDKIKAILEMPTPTDVRAL